MNTLQAVELLKLNEVVALPTETVYGLAGNAFSEIACAKIFKAKERPSFDPLIVHTEKLKTTDATSELESRGLITSSALSASARKTLQICAEQFWPGPLTLILPKHVKISDLVSSGLPTVGIRIPSHPLFQEVLQRLGLPLAAPSANRFGRISPVNADQVMSDLSRRIAGVLDGGTCSVGVESTILKILANGSVEVLRPGGTPLERIQAALGTENVKLASGAQAIIHEQAPLTAPGMLESHYAPVQPLYRLPKRLDEMKVNDFLQAQEFLKITTDGTLSAAQPIPSHSIALLSPDRDLTKLPIFQEISRAVQPPPSIHAFSLSETGNDIEAASRLFTILREMDALPNAVLWVEPITNPQGLYWAIQDRLKRASREPRTNERQTLK